MASIAADIEAPKSALPVEVVVTLSVTVTPDPAAILPIAQLVLPAPLVQLAAPAETLSSITLTGIVMLMTTSSAVSVPTLSTVNVTIAEFPSNSVAGSVPGTTATSVLGRAEIQLALATTDCICVMLHDEN